jgi:hypothetical protein
MALGSRFDPGGLFRCCVETIIEDDRVEYIGRTMTCTYCDAPLIVIQGYRHLEWQWDRSAEITIECIGQSITAGLDSEESSDAFADEARRRQRKERNDG